MKTSDAYSLYTVLLRFQADPRPAPVRFGYALALNTARLKEIADAYEGARMQLIQQTSEKDDFGNPVVEDGNYKLADPNTFNTGMADLGNAEVDIALVKLTIDQMPNEVEPWVVQVLLPMIEG